MSTVKRKAKESVGIPFGTTEMIFKSDKQDSGLEWVVSNFVVRIGMEQCLLVYFSKIYLFENASLLILLCFVILLLLLDSHLIIDYFCATIQVTATLELYQNSAKEGSGSEQTVS